MSTLTPKEIYLIFYRARGLFALTFALLFAASGLFAARWSHYRAEATVQIAPEEVPSSLAIIGNAEPATIAQGLADRRIRQIEQEITATDTLTEIIHTLDLYPNTRGKVSNDALAATLRKNFQLHFISSEIANPAATQKETLDQLSAIAFTASFTYDDPALAKRTLDEMLTRLITHEAIERDTRNRATLAFLDDEIATLAASIRTQEEQIAAFKSRIGETGSAAAMFHQQASLTGAMTLQTLTTQISSAEANIQALTAQLAATTPYLQADDHASATPLSKQSLETQLALLQSRYGAEYPDVVKLKQQLRTLTPTRGRAAVDANNPAYIQLASQLAATQHSLTALRNQREVLMKQQETHQQQLAAAPQIEQQMASLSLDLDHAKERYHTLQDKRLAAAMKAKLDTDSAKTRLQIIQPATTPAHTTPPRTLILLAGFFLALLGATGTVILRESLRQTVRSAHHLTHLLGAPPLVAIPRLEVH